MHHLSINKVQNLTLIIIKINDVLVWYSMLIVLSKNTNQVYTSRLFQQSQDWVRLVDFTAEVPPHLATQPVSTGFMRLLVHWHNAEGPFPFMITAETPNSICNTMWEV